MRGIVLIVLVASVVSVAGSAAAASQNSVHTDDLEVDAHRVLSQLTSYELLLLPSTLRDHVLSTLDAELPGPNAELRPDLDLLLRRVSTLALPNFGTSADAWSVQQSRVDNGLRLTFTPPSSPFSTSVDGSGSPGMVAIIPDDPSEASGGEQIAAGSASAREDPEAGTSIERAWDSVPPAGKVAIGAGILSLLLFGPLAMYSRIRRDDALENNTRRKVYEVVEQNPGLCIKDVSDRTAISYSTASYHLDRLVKTHFLVASGQGNRVLYYKNGGTFSREERDLVPILKNGECMRVFNHVLANPWCYRAEVALALGVSHTTVNWHLKRLIDAQLIQEHREGRNCHLFIDRPELDRVTGVLDKIEAMAAPSEPQQVAVAAIPA